MYADSSNGGYGHISDLITPTISATGPQCIMEFWYYMSGFTVGTFQVNIFITFEVQLLKINICVKCTLEAAHIYSIILLAY